MAKMGMAKNVVLTGLSFMCGVSQASARCTRFNLGCDMPALRASATCCQASERRDVTGWAIRTSAVKYPEARRAGISQPRLKRVQRAEAWDTPHINESPVRT